MNDLPDYELQSSSEAPLPEEKSGRWGLWVLAVLLVALLGAAVYYATIWRARPLPEKAAAPAPATKPTDQALGGTGEAIALPPLDASDSVVNTLVRALSTSPAIVRHSGDKSIAWRESRHSWPGTSQHSSEPTNTHVAFVGRMVSFKSGLYPEFQPFDPFPF